MEKDIVYDTDELNKGLGFKIWIKNKSLFIHNKCLEQQFILGEKEQEVLKKVLKCRKG